MLYTRDFCGCGAVESTKVEVEASDGVGDADRCEAVSLNGLRCSGTYLTGVGDRRVAAAAA